ncbi:MAG: FAD-dependent oxidoreductase [Candidatus Bipolaricaulia bacterium]
MALVKVDLARCKSCWNREPGFRCPVPLEALYESFRALQKVRSGPGAGEKMLIPPCVAACPANICVQGYLGLVAAGLYEEAYRLIRARVPFPQTLGLVCPAPCEQSCIRKDYDEPLAINPLKRFVAEWAAATAEVRRGFLEELKAGIEENGLKVGVVGAGPAGLACAHDLRLRGYDVRVYEALERPGGLLLTGIPPYRLPRSVLESELAEIFELGISFVGGVEFGEDLPFEELRAKVSAVFLAVGAQRGLRLGLPGEEAEGVYEALPFLREVNLGGRPKLGATVVVIGGGDAAIDSARVALRLGAKKVSILYRRSRAEMPAHPAQLAQAGEEGVELLELVSPVRFIAAAGRLQALELVRNELGEPDRSGRPRPVPIPGSEFTLEAEAALLALGQRPEPGLLQRLGVELGEGGLPLVDSNMMTSIAGLFAGGDLTTGPGTVIAAIAAGKRAAAGIDRYLRGERARPVYFVSPADLEWEERYHPSPLEVPPRARASVPQAPAAARRGDFRQVELGLSEKEARAEAERCLACGLCANCNACLDTFACPALGLDEEGRLAIDELLCNGCGVCPQLCPNDALVQVEGPGLTDDA